MKTINLTGNNSDPKMLEMATIKKVIKCIVHKADHTLVYGIQIDCDWENHQILYESKEMREEQLKIMVDQINGYHHDTAIKNKFEVLQND